MSDVQDICAVCLNQLNYPTKFPCSHIFCFLCAKGTIIQTHRCPLCRTYISPSFFDNPNLIKPVDIIEIKNNNNSSDNDDYHWFYEGKNGWWLYDESTMNEIEDSFGKNEKCIELLIAGSIYIIDFDRMIQFRKDYPNKIRRIKRDKIDHQTKGIAGIKASCNCDSNNSDNQHSHNVNIN